MESATCCDAMPSLPGAPSLNEEFESNERLLSRTTSGPPNATVNQSARQSPGRGLSRHCVSPICCYRPVDSVQSCWTWEALRLSTSCAYRWRRGSAMGLLQSEAGRASSCLRNTLAQRAARVLFCVSKRDRRSPRGAQCLPALNAMSRYRVSDSPKPRRRWFHFVSLRNAQAVPIGKAKQHGQAFDEPCRRTVCVSVCEGISGASGLAFATGAA